MISESIFMSIDPNTPHFNNYPEMAAQSALFDYDQQLEAWYRSDEDVPAPQLDFSRLNEEERLSLKPVDARFITQHSLLTATDSEIDALPAEVANAMKAEYTRAANSIRGITGEDIKDMADNNPQKLLDFAEYAGNFIQEDLRKLLKSEAKEAKYAQRNIEYVQKEARKAERQNAKEAKLANPPEEAKPGTAPEKKLRSRIKKIAARAGSLVVIKSQLPESTDDDADYGYDFEGFTELTPEETVTETPKKSIVPEELQAEVIAALAEVAQAAAKRNRSVVTPEDAPEPTDDVDLLDAMLDGKEEDEPVVGTPEPETPAPEAVAEPASETSTDSDSSETDPFPFLNGLFGVRRGTKAEKTPKVKVSLRARRDLLLGKLTDSRIISGINTGILNVLSGDTKLNEYFTDTDEHGARKLNSRAAEALGLGILAAGGGWAMGRGMDVPVSAGGLGHHINTALESGQAGSKVPANPGIVPPMGPTVGPKVPHNEIQDLIAGKHYGAAINPPVQPPTSTPNHGVSVHNVVPTPSLNKANELAPGGSVWGSSQQLAIEYGFNGTPAQLASATDQIKDWRLSQMGLSEHAARFLRPGRLPVPTQDILDRIMERAKA